VSASAWALAALAWASGCGSGSAAIAGASGGGGGSQQVPTTIEGVTLDDAVDSKNAPLTIRFRLIDPNRDKPKIQIRYTTKQIGGAWVFDPDPATLIDQRKRKTAPGGGQAHSFDWQFDQGLGPGWTPDVVVFVVIEGSTRVELGSNAFGPFGLGNFAPLAAATTVFPQPPQKLADLVASEFRLIDLNSERLRVKVEYQDAADPAQSWSLARPFDLSLPPTDPTPAYAFESVIPPAKAVFTWDSSFDLPGHDTEARLRFTVEEMDNVPAGCTTCSGEALTPFFRIDNNVAPSVSFDVSSFFLNPDASRGIPVPLTLADPEDAATVVLQWRYDTQAGFPALPDPNDPGALAQLAGILADPELRQAKQIAREIPVEFGGRAVPGPTSKQARLPELADAAMALVSRDAVVGARLEILRRTTTPGQIAWSAGTSLSNPVSVLARGSGQRVLVLDRQAGGWRLREIETATGAVALSVSGPGDPQAMAFEPDRASVLIASASSASNWSVQRVDLLTSPPAVLELYRHDGSIHAGTVRGLASLREHKDPVAGEVRGAFLVSVGDQAGSAVAQVDYRTGPPLVAGARVLLSGSGAQPLDVPWGIAVDPDDPGRVFIAENGRDRVVSLDLETRALEPVPAIGLLTSPTDLALVSPGRRLLVVTDEAHDGAFELRGVNVGRDADRDRNGRGDMEVYLLGTSQAPFRGLTIGEDEFLAFVDPNAGVLYAGGGVEQVRTIGAYDPETQIVTVDTPFAPGLPNTRRWRIAEGVNSRAVAGRAAARTFVWDSSQAGRSGTVFLRAFAFDAGDMGSLTNELPKTIRPAFDTQALLPPSFPQTSGRALVDLDGDFDLDVVSSDGTDIGILTQRAPGDFRLNPMAIAGATTFGLAAHVDSDALADIVSGGAVHRQSAAFPGTFPAWCAPFPTCGTFGQGGERALTSADFDGNGLLDLAALNAGRIDLFLQGPADVFVRDPIGLNHPNPTQVVACDLDADGRLDLVVGEGGTSIAVYLQGGGGFSTTPSSVLASPTELFTAFVVRDLHADGLFDVAATLALDPLTLAGSEVVVFEDVGLASGITAPTSKYGNNLTTADPADVDSADLDGDGRLDLLTINRGGSGPAGVTVFFQDEKGRFPPNPDGALSSGQGDALEVRDLDGDGRLDVVTDSAVGQLRFHLREVPGRWSRDPVVLGFAQTGYQEPIVADFDDDGDLDLLAPWSGRRELHLFKQQSVGKFDPSPIVLLNSPLTPIQEAVSADVDGDGDVDLVALAETSPVQGNFFRVFPGPLASGQAPIDVLTAPGPAASSDALAVGDLIAGGRLEVVVRIPGSGIRFYEQPSLGAFVLSPTAIGSGGCFALVDASASNPVTQMLLPDGDLDVVEIQGGVIVVHEQNPKGVFTSRALPITLTGGDCIEAVVDLDRNGLVDVVVFDSTLVRQTIHFQAGPGVWTASQWVNAGRAVVTDIDSDRLLDLAAMDSGGVSVFLQLRPRAFQRELNLVTPLPALRVGAAPLPRWDFDGDGDRDIAVPNASTNRIEIYWGGR
jgi:hypothetical protein